MSNEAIEALVVISVVAMTCGIPLLGLTIRFSLKPLVEAWIRLREAQLASPQWQLQVLRDRVAHLERELELRGLMDRQPPAPLQQFAPEPLPAGVKDRERIA
jgi:hypothetical protein